MEVKLAQRMDFLKPHFFAVLNSRLAALQAQGKTVIRMDEGAPDLPPAPHIIEALVRAARRADAHSYQPHRGSSALREAWAGWYRSQHGVTLDPETEVLPLLGSKEGIFHLSQAFLQPGDLALVPDPGYVTYTRGALFAGAQVAYFPLLPERGYLPDFQALKPEILAKCKLMWLNYPNNPTGASAPLELFEQAVELARRNNFIVCHDAAYSRVAFEGLRPLSLLQVEGAREAAVEFNTLSKSHNMAGWRTGALLGNPQAVRALFTLKTNADSSHFQPIFEATIAALTGDQSWLEERNDIYRRRRDVLIAGLREIGLPATAPRAALYVWAPLPPGWESEAFALAALEGAGVSVTPGTVFGENGQGYIRIALCAPVEEIETAMQRLGGWLRTARFDEN